MTARYGTNYNNTMGFWGLIDELHGLGGDDVLDGRWGSGRMYGGRDSDIYYIDGLNDQVIELPNEGRDKVYSSISYTLRDNVEDLELTGNATDGTGNNLQNHIIGNDRDNTLDGRAGADILEGGRGNDAYYVDVAGDEVIENAGEGTDTVYSTAFAFTLDANVERLVLIGSAAIDGTGNGLDNRITGNGSTNELRGEGGRDTLDGNGGGDIMWGGIGHDTYYVGHVDDEVIEYFGEGSDLVKSWIDYTLPDNVESLALLDGAPNPEVPAILGSLGLPIDGTGNALSNSITGNSGDNVLSGLDGDDEIDGGRGADDMYGGRGDDFYIVEHPRDEVFEYQNEGYDIVVTTVSYTLSDHVEELNLVGDSDMDGTGNNQDNYIWGNSFANVLDGRGGSDTLFGGSDADTFVFVHSDGGIIFDDEEDVVWDFQAGIDRIDLRETEIDSWADLVGGNDDDFMQQVGSDVVIHTTDYDTVTLTNVQLSSLMQADFLFG